MKDQARLLNGSFSEGLETVTLLVRCTDFTVELGKLIRQPGGAERAVNALRREFLGIELIAPVVYVQPRFEELKRWFPAYVNPDYKGKRFDPIKRCKTVSKENRKVAFEYVCLDRDAWTDEVLAEMERKNLRPALYEELLGFTKKYPNEQRKFPIVALGSETVVNDEHIHLCLWIGDSGRSLNLDLIDRSWHGSYRFLAVRE